MKVVAVLLLLAVTVLADKYHKEFKNFVTKYEKSYKHDDIHNRFTIFKNNFDFIEAHNAKNLSFTVGMNQFGDLTLDEFKQFYLGLRVSDAQPTSVHYFNTVNIPDAVDWTTKGAVTPVKNQGQCGSCWAFSTTGSLEGLHKIKKGTLMSFSEQQLVDCSGSYGNQGCNGGLMDDAFKYVAAKGIELESTYPYKGVDETCRYKESDTKFKNTGFHDVAANNEPQLTAAIANQPVSVAIEADSQAFQFYKSGIFNDPSCGTNLDHGVLAVGYGVDGKDNFYKVKNSWGADWGELGYIRMHRDTTAGKPGMCGIAMMASYPTLA
jgi:cathepsin L